MNIFAIEGHLVRCKTHDAGCDYDQETAKKYLVLGNTYTVDYTIVHSWSTNVYVKEWPGISFNSVFFEDVKPQSTEDDKKHIDYSKWRKS